MFKRLKKKIFWIFWLLLVFYIVAQLLWWTFLLLQIYQDANRVNSDTKIVMIIGESVVFFLVLMVFFYQVYRVLKQEIILRRHQNDFLLSMSHELKTPLSVVQLGLETLFKRKNLDEKIRENLIISILKEHKKFQKLIQNILTAAKIEQKYQPKDFIQPKKLNLSEFCQRWVNQYNQVVQGLENILLILSDIQEDIWIIGDEYSLESILYNLSENSVQHNKPGIQIQLKIYKDKNFAYILFQDDGKGIIDAEKRKIFKKFYKIFSEVNENIHGTGLGLYIVQQIIQAHGGQISVSDNVPKGTIFTIQIPLII